jgi:hypothetical protein
LIFAILCFRQYLLLNLQPIFQSISVSKEVINKVRQCTCKCNIEVRSGNHYCRGKAICITYSECESLVLVIQHAMRVRRIIFISAAVVALHCFSTLFQKSWFSENEHWTLNIEHKMF